MLGYIPLVIVCAIDEINKINKNKYECEFCKNKELITQSKKCHTCGAPVKLNDDIKNHD